MVIYVVGTPPVLLLCFFTIINKMVIYHGKPAVPGDRVSVWGRVGFSGGMLGDAHGTLAKFHDYDRDEPCVAFDDPIDGHDCDGYLPHERGWYLDEDQEVEVLKGKGKAKKEKKQNFCQVLAGL